MALQSAIYGNHSGAGALFHRLDARTKIVCCLALIVLCVTARPDAYLSFLGYGVVLAAVVVISRVPPGRIAGRLLAVMPFVALVAISIPFLRSGPAGGEGGAAAWRPGALQGGMVLFWNVLIKATVSVASLTLLTATTPVPLLLDGLRRLKVPAFLVMLGGFTYRYIFVLADRIGRMKRAGDARGFSCRRLWQAKVIGQMIGTLFLGSYEQAERVGVAMISRGFDGATPYRDRRPLRTRDLICLAATIPCLVAIRLGLS